MNFEEALEYWSLNPDDSDTDNDRFIPLYCEENHHAFYYPQAINDRERGDTSLLSESDINGICWSARENNGYGKWIYGSLSVEKAKKMDFLSAPSPSWSSKKVDEAAKDDNQKGEMSLIEALHFWKHSIGTVL